MHPGMIAWWKARREASCGAHPGWGWGHGPSHGHEGYEASPEEYGAGGHGAFGVRRPLRFLAYKLGLSEPQVADLARILDELKTERAQAAVDHRRSVSGIADAVEGATFDEKKAREAVAVRVATAERLRDAVVRALGKIHAVLSEEQRKQLAYLIRTGALLI